MENNEREIWTVKPDDTIARTEVHKLYGGSSQGGISPSAKSPNILIFSDPEIGQIYGYNEDGWRAGGLFYYTGEGQQGDQQFVRGNLAILQHGEEGRALRVFEGVRGTVRYVGQFEVDSANPYERTDAPEYRSDRIRQVIVFRLKPVDIVPRPSDSKLDELPASVLSEVALEQQHTESAFVNPRAQGYEINRREQKLVAAYQSYLRAKGFSLVRHQMHPKGESKPLFSDIYDKARNNLLEAKGSVSRESIRMSIGQLADYSRFLDPKPKLGVLVPSRPRSDLESLLLSQGIYTVWQTEDGQFADNASGVLI